MTAFDRHEPGTFCYVELTTTDRPGASVFYTQLFGWTAEDNPLPDGSIYTTFKLGERTAAAAYEQRDEERAQGVPPHWNLHASVHDVDKSTEVARSAGASVLAGPFDVMDLGRMSVIADPVGAVLSLWQPGRSIGFEIADQAGSFTWGELVTPDTERAAAFYGELFGWTAERERMAPYILFQKDGRSVAGLSAPTAEGVPTSWYVYFEVTDAEAVTEAASEGGGHPEMGPQAVEGVGTFAILADSAHAVFGILQPARPTLEAGESGT